MFSTACDSETATQLLTQHEEFQWQNQAVQEVAVMSQTLQEHLHESHVQQQQQTHSLPSYYKPPPPYPLHLLQPPCHEGIGQSNNRSDIANTDKDSLLYQLLNEQESLTPISTHDWQNWEPILDPIQCKPLPPYHLQPQGHDSHWDHEQSNNNTNDLSIHHQNQLLPPNSTSPPTKEPPVDAMVFLEELEKFSRAFKKRRIKLGFTQKDVGLAVRKLYGNDFSQTTISRFESLNLSLKNMCHLKPLLQKWLEKANNSLNNPSVSPSRPSTPEPSGKRRKRRTIIGKSELVALKEAFTQKSRPSYKEINILADELGMEKEIVRVWFCNRRARARRINPSFESPCPPMHQYDMFAPHEVIQGPLPRSSPPPYSASHLFIQI